MLLDLFSTIVGGLLAITGVAVSVLLVSKPIHNPIKCPFIFDETCDKKCLYWVQCNLLAKRNER